MTPDRDGVDVAIDRLRCRVREFETAWDALPPAPKRVLVLRCSGLSIKEVGLHLRITPYTVKEYGKLVMQTMREATGVGDVSALCWLYGYSRALRDIDAQVVHKRRSHD